MLRDAMGSIVAAVVFLLVLYAPGYLAAWGANLFGFRQRSFAERSIWAIACSFCVSPIAAHLLGRAFGLNAVCWFFALASVAALTTFLSSGKFAGWSKHDRRVTAAAAVGWVALVLLLLVDLQLGHRLYYSVVMADQSYRIAFTDAVVRTGIPPANPLYFADGAAPMRYYYFWYVLCGAVVKLGHVSARQAFIASSIWAAIGLTVTVKLYATNFFQWSRKTTWIAIALLLVTGADLLPALGNLFLQSSINGNSEWWSVDQVDAWPDSILWVPHHVASVLCCLIAFLILWRVVVRAERTNIVRATILAAAACASAFGLSVYVAIGFAIMMACWLLRAILKTEPQRKEWVQRSAITGALGAALLAPFLHELLAKTNATSSATTPGPAHLLRLSVRPLIDSQLITSLPVFSALNKTHPFAFDQLVRLLLLAPGMAMEFGLYGAVLILLLFARRRREFGCRDQALNAAMFLAVAGLAMTMFISSSVITNNDFGYRAVMLPQFFLTLLTAHLIGSWSFRDRKPLLAPTRFRKGLVSALLILGIAGTVYWAVLLRAWLPITAAQAASGFQESPEDAYQVREAFAKLDRIAPKTAVVAFRDMDLDIERKDMEVMTPTEFFQRMLVMDTGRQILNAEPKCATHFGGDPNSCSATKLETLALYSSPSPSPEWAQAYCRKHQVNYLLFTSRDPSWSVPSGWNKVLPVVVQEPRLKILLCAQTHPAM